MGSEANKGILRGIGIDDPQIDQAEAKDLIAAVVADTPEIVKDSLGRLDEYLQGVVQPAATSNPHTFEEGLKLKPQANLAVISIPGEYAAREARTALEAGLSAFIFSSNVSGDDELALKRFAAEKGLLVMGPDCGTSIIGGVGIGFANAVRRGPIGVVGAAGTGLQEFTSQVHNAGGGISHAIGTGGHDLSDQIGGLTALAGFDALERDVRTKVIVVISKPPGPKTHAALVERFKTCTKPVVACFLGTGASTKRRAGTTYQTASTIDEAVALALAAAGVGAARTKSPADVHIAQLTAREPRSWSKEQKYLRGLFAGGTFCYQSQQILRDAGIRVHSNAPLDANDKLADSNRSIEHTVVDMGSEEYTLGRPHPMIDGSLRRQRILTEARDPQTAILLLDFVLGYNASMDPVGVLLDAIIEAKRTASAGGRNLTVVASVCGTNEDPQDLDNQIKMLHEAGVLVFQSSAVAVEFCAALLKARGGRDGKQN
jgi:succinyl-CoA synthetase alpha subunit